MEIRPGIGVGQLLFGLSEDELVHALGPPDKRYHEDSGTLQLQYFDLLLEFQIEPEDGGRVGWVRVYSPDASLFGQRVIGAPIASVLRMVSEALDEEPECEDYGWLESYFYERGWVEVQTEFGRVRSVSLGVLFGDDDEPQWPAAGPLGAADAPP